jgi:two-component system OmpR family response regulator
LGAVQEKPAISWRFRFCRQAGPVPAASPRILVVDDEENISYLVGAGLRAAGCTVATAATGDEALSRIDTFRPDAIVLDVMLPDLDGYEVLRRLRARGCTVPTLLLTARAETAERVRGLTSGAEDYIVKPFALEEVVARVQLVLRRHGHANEGAARMQVHDLVLDDDARRVWRGTEEAALTPTEYTLLRCLMLNAGRVVTRAQILDQVWHYDFDGESTIVESFVSSLRRKVDNDDVRLIHTVRGVGYSIREP